MGVRFDGGVIEEESPTFIIAEAGSNHNGDLHVAKQLVDVAAQSGADAVKFQTFRAERHYVEESGKADYLEDDRTLYEILADLEMPYDWIPELHDYAESQDILFLSTPSDIESAKELAPYVPIFKVESFNLSNLPFLSELAAMGKPLVLSTGAHDRDEIKEAVEHIRDEAAGLVLLHCVSAYPTPLEAINVRAVERLAQKFDVPVGFSDHTLDPTVAPSAAVALGASVVEKHFTLDTDLEGPDHGFALDPDELSRMVDAIRRTETALGNGRLGVSDAEREMADLVRRYVQATRDIEEGERITKRNTDVLSPGQRGPGVEPKHYTVVLGRTSQRSIPSGEGITWDAVDGNPPDDT